MRRDTAIALFAAGATAVCLNACGDSEDETTGAATTAPASSGAGGQGGGAGGSGGSGGSGGMACVMFGMSCEMGVTTCCDDPAGAGFCAQIGGHAALQHSLPRRRIPCPGVEMMCNMMMEHCRP